MSERRSEARARSYLGGQVHFNKNAFRADCVVRNLSATGARLRFSQSVLIPDRFKLTVTPKSVRHDARIVWRTIDEAGVTFTNERKPSESPNAARSRRLRRALYGY